MIVKEGTVSNYDKNFVGIRLGMSSHLYTFDTVTFTKISGQSHNKLHPCKKVDNLFYKWLGGFKRFI